VAKEETSAAHVAAPDESAREEKGIAEDVEEHGRVFGSRNAAEEHDLYVRVEVLETRGVPAKRLDVRGMLEVDVVRRERAQRLDADEVGGGAQAFVRRDHENILSRRGSP
jgi:hypothetical protein